MKSACVLPLVLSVGALLLVVAIDASADLPPRQSSLLAEPGAINLEGIKGASNVRLTVAQDGYIYYHAIMDRVLGTMKAGTPVTLIAMSETAYRVRGRAAHGETAGWMPIAALQSPDPQLAEKLKALYTRQQQISELTANRQVALGMTSEEVQQSLGKPTRRNTRIAIIGREERLEYAIFESVPQVMTGRDQYGQLVQSVVYIKVETGTLTLHLKNGVVDTIEETKGTPLGGRGIKIVPAPIFLR
jgi:hypothetical protein